MGKVSIPSAKAQARYLNYPDRPPKPDSRTYLVPLYHLLVRILVGGVEEEDGRVGCPEEGVVGQASLGVDERVVQRQRSSTGRGVA